MYAYDLDGLFCPGSPSSYIVAQVQKSVLQVLHLCVDLNRRRTKV